MRLFAIGPRVAGVRLGVSVSQRDLASLFGGSAYGAMPDLSAATRDGFIYVIKNAAGRCKVGITGNPIERINNLRTGSAEPIEFAWIGIPEDDTVLIESDALATLDRYRTHRDWFDVTPDIAVAAISAAAQRRGRPVLGVTLDQAEQIRLIAVGQAAQRGVTKSKPPFLLRAVATVAFMIFCAVIAVALTMMLSPVMSSH